LVGDGKKERRKDQKKATYLDKCELEKTTYLVKIEEKGGRRREKKRLKCIAKRKNDPRTLYRTLKRGCSPPELREKREKKKEKSAGSNIGRKKLDSKKNASLRSQRKGGEAAAEGGEKGEKRDKSAT